MDFAIKQLVVGSTSTLHQLSRRASNVKHEETADQNGNYFLTFLDDAFSFGRQRDLATSTAKPSLDTHFGGGFWSPGLNIS